MEKNIKNVIEKSFKVVNIPEAGKQIFLKENVELENEFYCNECLANRQMNINNIKSHRNRNIYTNDEDAIEGNLPLIYQLKCLQCKAKAYLIIYKNNNKLTTTILYEKAGGCASKSASEGVKYYLNEAHLSKNIGAKSASMSMYRAAMDFMLYNQGYTKGMLGNKIDRLQKDIEQGKAPKWALEIDMEYLEVIKEIGNSSIHPNDGDITRQKEIDEKLLNVVDIVFSELLDKIYEQPIRSKNNLEILKAKMENLNKKLE